jgi:hypothetical protein
MQPLRPLRSFSLIAGLLAHWYQKAFSPPAGQANRAFIQVNAWFRTNRMTHGNYRHNILRIG